MMYLWNVLRGREEAVGIICVGHLAYLAQKSLIMLSWCVPNSLGPLYPPEGGFFHS